MAFRIAPWLRRFSPKKKYILRSLKIVFPPQIQRLITVLFHIFMQFCAFRKIFLSPYSSSLMKVPKEADKNVDFNDKEETIWSYTGLNLPLSVSVTQTPKTAKKRRHFLKVSLINQMSARISAPSFFPAASWNVRVKSYANRYPCGSLYVFFFFSRWYTLSMISLGWYANACFVRQDFCLLEFVLICTLLSFFPPF